MVGPAVLLVLVSLDRTGVGAGSVQFLGQASPGGPPGSWNADAICPQCRSTEEGARAQETVELSPYPRVHPAQGIWRRSAPGPGGEKGVGVTLG